MSHSADFLGTWQGDGVAPQLAPGWAGRNGHQGILMSTKSPCSRMTSCLQSTPWGAPPLPWLRVSAPPSPKEAWGCCGWGGPGPGWNVWSWWVGKGAVRSPSLPPLGA